MSLSKIKNQAILIISFLTILSVGCSNGGNDGGGNSGTEAVNPRDAVVNGASQYESQLKQYGVHFEVKQSNNLDLYPSYGSNYSRIVIAVELKMTAKDSDLISLGLLPENRDNLIMRMTDLWQTIERHRLHLNSTDKDLVIAILKVKTARLQYILPKLNSLYLSTLTLRQPSTNRVSFEYDTDLGLTLWHDDPTKLSNKEALESIETRLSTHSELESLKAKYLDQLISDLTQSNNLEANPQTSKTLEILQKIKEFTFLSSEEISSLNDLKAELATKNGDDVLDVHQLTELNNQMIQRKRTELLGVMEKSLNESMIKLGLNFLEENSTVIIDPKSISRARINGVSTDSIYELQLALAAKETKYDTFVRKYGNRSKKPAGEDQLINKFELFHKL